MLWALLITLLIAKLSGGPEEIFMIPKLEKEIKAQVVDKERKQEILLIAKNAKKEIKSFQKVRNKTLKEISKKAQDQQVSSEQLMQLYQQYYEARLVMQKQLIEMRLAIQQAMTDSEWKQLISDSVLPSDKVQWKTEKTDRKEDDKVDKLITDIEQTIRKEINDPKKEAMIMSNLKTFTITLKEFVQQRQNMNFKDNELIRNKNASREDLENFYKEENELRLKGTEEYFKIRQTAIHNATDDEWKSIVKALNKIAKS